LLNKISVLWLFLLITVPDLVPLVAMQENKSGCSNLDKKEVAT